MTREEFDKKISECYSGSECYQVCKEYIKTLEVYITDEADILVVKCEKCGHMMRFENPFKPKTVNIKGQ